MLELGYLFPVQLRANILGRRKQLVRSALSDVLPVTVQRRANWGFLPLYYHWLSLDFIRAYAYDTFPQIPRRVGLDLVQARRVLDDFYLQKMLNQARV